MKYDLQTVAYLHDMTYGKRLAEAMEHRSKQLGRKIGRLEVAGIANCSRQNIGMILTGSQGDDQKLSTESHAAVAAFLKVNPNWLLKGEGKMDALPSADALSRPILSEHAEVIASEFDKIQPQRGAIWAASYSQILQIILLAQQSLKPEREQPQGPETQPAPLQAEPSHRKSPV